MAAVVRGSCGRAFSSSDFLPLEDDFLMSSRPAVLRAQRITKRGSAAEHLGGRRVRARHTRSCGQCGEQVTRKHWFSNAFYTVLCRKCFYGSVSD
jgi:hypothetical protein